MQRSHEKVMNEILSSDNKGRLHHQDESSRPNRVANAQSHHIQLMQEIIGRHGLPHGIAAELEAIHTHHHSLAFNLVHREVVSGGTAVTATAGDQKVPDKAPARRAPSRPASGAKANAAAPAAAAARASSSPRKKSVEAVHQVHALVMEEVLAKHAVHFEAVEELRKEQERHKVLLAELLTRTHEKNNKHSKSTGTAAAASAASAAAAAAKVANSSKSERDTLLAKSSAVQQVQENHKQLMLAIMQKHNLHHTAVAQELEAVHSHHHAIVASLVKQHDSEDIEHHDQMAAAAAAAARSKPHVAFGKKYVPPKPKEEKDDGVAVAAAAAAAAAAETSIFLRSKRSSISLVHGSSRQSPAAYSPSLAPSGEDSEVVMGSSGAVAPLGDKIDALLRSRDASGSGASAPNSRSGSIMLSAPRRAAPARPPPPPAQHSAEVQDDWASQITDPSANQPHKHHGGHHGKKHHGKKKHHGRKKHGRKNTVNLLFG